MASDTAIVREWDTSVEYLVDQLIYTSTDPEINIQYQDKFFRCKSQHTSFSFTSDFGNNLWEEAVVRGVKGDTGTTGATGLQGVQGLTGPAGANGGDGADGIFSQIADLAEAQTGTNNTKGMTPLRTQDNFDFNIVSRDGSIATNTSNIGTNSTNIGTNTADIAAIVIDNAQITTNQNDIAGLVLVDIGLQNQIDAIVIDNAQIATNQADIATLNTVTIPGLQDQLNTLSGRITSLESNFQLSNASGEQELLNGQVAPLDILGNDYGPNGTGNRWELNNTGAKTARIRAEIYRKDSIEERFSVAMLEMHFLEATNTWFLGRTWTTLMTGLPDGITFDITTSNPAAGIFVGQVNYVSDTMAGVYDSSSYVKFLLEEISNL